MLYWLGHATPDYLTLGENESITPSDLRNLLRSFDDRERPEGMLAFLNACQTAEAGQTGSFLDVLHSFGFTGAIATEQQTIDNFANELGLAFLRGFLQRGPAAGRAAARAAAEDGAAGPALRRPLPPEIRVRIAADRTAFDPPRDPRVRQGRRGRLQAPRLRFRCIECRRPSRRAARAALPFAGLLRPRPTAPCSPAATPTSSGSPRRSTGRTRGS